MSGTVNARGRRWGRENGRSRRTGGLTGEAAALFALVLAACVLNLRVVSSGDNIPTRLLPFSLLLEGDLDLDEFPRLRSRQPLPYYVRLRGGHLYPGTGVVLPLVIAPLYLPAAALVRAADIRFDDVRFEVLQVVMERVAAAALAAITAVLVFLALARSAAPRMAPWLAAAYALATPAWSIAGMALWPHGLTALVVAAVSLLLLDGDLPPRRAALAGGLLALGLANRPQLAAVALPATAVAASAGWRPLAAFAAPAALGGAALAAWNLAVFGTLAGAYGSFRHFGWPWEGVAGLLVSPNRGLFVYCPLLLLAVPGMWRAMRHGRSPWLRWGVAAVALHLLLYGAFEEWWGGYAYGPRYMTGILPLLILYLPQGIEAARAALPARHAGAALRWTCAVLTLHGIAVQAVGVYCAQDSWNRTPVPLEADPARVWEWRDWQVLREAGNGFHGADLAPLLASVWRQGRVPLRRLPPAGLAARYEPLTALPGRLRAGGQGTLAVRLHNLARTPWPAFAADYRVHHRVFVVLRWLGPGGRQIPGAGAVVPLPRNVLPGQSVEVRVAFGAPRRRGRFEAELRVAQALSGTGGVPGPQGLRWPVRVE